MNRLIKTLGILTIVFSMVCIMGAAPQPPGGTGAATQTSFEQSSPFSYTQVCSSVRQWIPLTPSNISATDTLADSAITVHNTGAGTPNSAVINSSGVTGLLMDSDNSDDVDVLWPIPGDIDLAQPIYIKILFSESSSSVGSSGFTTQYLPIVAGTTAIAAQSTTTGITDGAEIATSATANAIQWTNATTVAASTFSTMVPGQDFIVWEFTVQFTTVSDSSWYGVQIQYSRRYLGCGQGM